MLYATMLKRCKQSQENNYKYLEHCLAELTTPASNDDEALYKEIANYVLNDSNNRYIYYKNLSKDHTDSVITFLIFLKHALFDDGEITAYWNEITSDFDGSVYLEPKLEFIYSEYLIQDYGIKRENIIPIKDFVSVLKKHSQDLLEQEKLNEEWEINNSL